jgi:hypothetical protein
VDKAVYKNIIPKIYVISRLAWAENGQRKLWKGENLRINQE